MNPVSASYDSKGRITRIWEADHSRPPRTRIFAARRLDWDRAIATGDPGSKLSTPITDDGTKITASMIGSWTTSDLYDGNNPYGVWPVLDPWGAPMSGTACGAMSLLLMTSDASSGDAVFASLALVNETDLTTATIDGRGVGFNYSSAGTFLGYSHSLINGAYSSAASGSTGSSRGVVTQVRVRDNNTASSRLGADSAIAVDSAWVYAGASATSAGAVIFGAPRWYLAVVFARTDAAVSATKTISAAAYYIAHPYTEFPA